MMRLSLVLSLTMALCMLSLLPGTLGLLIHPNWFFVRREGLPEDLKQPPIVAESVAAEWPGSIGLRSPRRWVRVERGIVPEGQKQLPAGAESVASDLPYPLGQLWDYLTQGRERTALASVGTDRWEKDTRRRYEFLYQIEVTAWLIRCLRREGLPEDLKKPPIVAESVAAEWPGSIGLRSPRRWVRFRMGVVPEGQKQPSAGAESVAFVLPYPLGQLWDYLAQVDMTWLLCRALQTVWLLCIAWITLRLGRKAMRPQGQGRERTASSSVGTDRWEKDTRRCYELLCRTEANTTRLVRLLHRLRLKELRRLHYKKKA